MLFSENAVFWCNEGLLATNSWICNFFKTPLKCYGFCLGPCRLLLPCFLEIKKTNRPINQPTKKSTNRQTAVIPPGWNFKKWFQNNVWDHQTANCSVVLCCSAFKAQAGRICKTWPDLTWLVLHNAQSNYSLLTVILTVSLAYWTPDLIFSCNTHTHTHTCDMHNCHDKDGKLLLYNKLYQMLRLYTMTWTITRS